MLIKLDFEKDRIMMNSDQDTIWFNRLVKTPYFWKEWSRVRSKMRKYFVVDGINYTEIFAYLMHRDDFFSKAPGLMVILHYLELLDNVNEKKELELQIHDFYYETFKKCAYLVSKKKKFTIKILEEEYIKRKLGLFYNNAFFVRNILRARFFMRYLLGRLRKTLGKHNNHKADVLFLSNIRFEYDLPENNSMFGSIIKELNKKKIKNKDLRYEELEPLDNLQRFVKKFFLQKEAYIGDYYSLKHFLKCEKDFKILRKRWETVKNNPYFKRIFIYKGYDYYDLIKPKLELLFKALNYISCDCKNIAEAVIEKEDYRVLVLDQEENILGKAFMLNMRTGQKRKTVALSHELIHPITIHTHIKDKKTLNRNSVLWRPLPDIKCVWNIYSKKILLSQCNYPNKIIRITGNPKFDLLFKCKYDHDGIIKKYRLLKEEKKVLWAPSPINLSYLNQIDRVSRELGNLEFIIKPHPGESKVAQIKEKLQQLKNPLLTYVNNKDNVYPLISVADYVLTDASTAGFEGMLMNKIVICHRPPSSIRLPSFLEGIIQIPSLSSLTKELRKLENKGTSTKVKNKIKMITNYYHYKNDGRAAERVADEIERLLEKSIKIKSIS